MKQVENAYATIENDVQNTVVAGPISAGKALINMKPGSTISKKSVEEIRKKANMMGRYEEIKFVKTMMENGQSVVLSQKDKNILAFVEKIKSRKDDFESSRANSVD